MEKLILSEETLGYVTNKDVSNTDKRFLVGGSKNVLIDTQKKVKIRSGYTRLGAANTALNNVRNAWTWETSQGQVYPQRFYDDELEVYLRTIDTYDINAWTRVANGWNTTNKLRSITSPNGGGGWFDSTEKIDLQLMVIGDDKIYEWGGGVAVVSSSNQGAGTVTKKGTTTFGENHFYVSRNKTFICVRTGTEYTYTGGESTTTLTTVATSGTWDLVENDILVQKIVTNDNKPEDAYLNDFIYNFQNQILIGSKTDNRVFVSSNTAYATFTNSNPRVPGEGATLTLDGPTRGLSSVGQYFLVGSGKSVIYRSNYNQLDVGGTLTETLEIKKIHTGTNQGFYNQESIIPVGDQIIYLTNEPALRIFSDPDELSGINPKNLSNPIKPDFDAEDWTDAFGIWDRNTVYLASQANSRLYMLNFVEDADGKLFRYWNPPQVVPVEVMSLIDSGTGNDLSNGVRLHIHSNAVPETYLVFDGASDGQYSGMDTADKLPIDAKAVFAYNNYGKRGTLKNFDEYYIDGEITPNTTDLTCTLDYDFDGATQSIEKTIDGSNEDILEGSVGINSLAQQSLALNPLGGLLNPPSDARRFRAVFEIAKEDFFELRATFSTNEVDRYWAIIAHGANVQLSRRKPINIKV